MISAVARSVEDVVREDPTQWFNFYRFWPDRARG
jgi:predicted LPLAT superfamily acyltransferase